MTKQQICRVFSRDERREPRTVVEAQSWLFDRRGIAVCEAPEMAKALRDAIRPGMHSISIPFLPRLRLDEPDEPIMKDAPNYAEFELREWRERPANGSPGFGAMALCFVDDEQMRRFLFVLQEEQLNPPRSTEELLITLILRALEERRSQ